MGGDWDLERRHELAETVKYQAVVQRYSEGKRWEDTELFEDIYARRIKSESIRGCQTMGDLLAQYYGRVDDMFKSMRTHGFIVDRGPLPVLLIGRDGDVFIGNQGNHRLAMAHVLGFRKFVGDIVCRHSCLIEA